MDNYNNKSVKEHFMVSDIRTNSTSDTVSNKTSDRMSLVMVLTTIGLAIWLIFIHGFIMNIFKIEGFVIKLILFLIFAIFIYIESIEIFVNQRRKKDKQTREIISKGGDMVAHFMRVKDIKSRNFGFNFNVTVIETSAQRVIPIEITYSDMHQYSVLIDSIIKSNCTFQEFRLKGKITLFDKFRGYYFKFPGETLIKILESIYRENEKVQQKSPSRRCYLLINMGYSTDIESVITSMLRMSRCKIQFLDEKMYKEVIERYFGAPINLEHIKSNVVVRQISLEDTKLVEMFGSEDEVEEFLRTYKTINIKPSSKFTLRGQSNSRPSMQREVKDLNPPKINRKSKRKVERM